MSNSGNMTKGSRQNKRPAPLRMVKPEEVRQYRPPVIIHTYSPKIIHVDAAQFSSLVQSLTGRGQKRKPDASPRAQFTAAEEFSCTSPSSSIDSGITQLQHGQHGLVSPRGPLAPFDHLLASQFDASCAPSQSAPSQATNVFTNVNALMAAAAASTPSGGPQYSPLFSSAFGPNSFPHLFSPLPSPNLLSPNFMADLPALSPSTYQAFDPFGSHPFVTSPDYGRFSGAGVLSSPGTFNAYKEMALMMARD